MTSLPAIDGPRVLPASGAAPTSMVILAHGYGSNGEDLIGLAPYWAKALPDTVFIAPNAPQICPGAPDGYQWWPVWDMDRRLGAESAAPVLDAFIDAELARYGLSEGRLALVGFSQGTMLSLNVAPRRARQVAGVVGYSGMLIEPAPADIVTKPPILLVHGAEDPMIPVSAFRQAVASLTSLGFDVASHVSPGLCHSIDLEGLRLGEAFLTKVLA
jgi:phospholipase/carboxylesterase